MTRIISVSGDSVSNLLENKKSTGEISDRNSIQKMHTKWENYVSISLFIFDDFYAYAY